MRFKRPKAATEEERLQRKREQRKAAELKRKPGARRAYEARRQLRDPVYRMKKAARATLYKRVRGKFKTIHKRSQALLGCDYAFLKQYLESLFKPGMTWENYGIKGWHVDHIKPLSIANTPEEMATLCHYTNLQPLWWHENIAKSDNLAQSS
jgi:hypothetical protein